MSPFLAFPFGSSKGHFLGMTLLCALAALILGLFASGMDQASTPPSKHEPEL